MSMDYMLTLHLLYFCNSYIHNFMVLLSYQTTVLFPVIQAGIHLFFLTSTKACGNIKSLVVCFVPQVAPSVAYDAASMNELRKWNEQYGEGGTRRKSPFGF